MEAQFQIITALALVFSAQAGVNQRARGIGQPSRSSHHSAPLQVPQPIYPIDHANILDSSPLELPASTAYSRENFISPNEYFPERAIPIYLRANRGTYVAVGTERGFIGAALSRSNRLVLIDSSPEVVRYNRINIALLELARNREDYIRLRAQASASQWRDLAQTLAPSHPLRSLLMQGENWTWWNNNVRTPPTRAMSLNWTFDSFNGRPRANSSLFRNANYTQDDALFTRLQTLARQNRIESHLIDLRDSGAISRLSTALSARHATIGILDMSNVWFPKYLKPEGSARVIHLFRPALRNDSIVMLTSLGGELWSYNAFTGQYLSESPNLSRTLAQAYNMTIDRNMSLSVNGQPLEDGQETMQMDCILRSLDQIR